jgi:hypothetical protein
MDLCYDGWTDRVPQKAPTAAGLVATTAAGAKVGFVRINALADVAHWEPTINVLEQSCL